MTPDEALALLDSWVERPACDGEITGELIAATLAFDAARARLGEAVAAYKRETRTLVRCRLGGMGANWGLDDAAEALRRASEIHAREPSVFGLGLVAIVDGKHHAFGTRKDGES